MTDILKAIDAAYEKASTGMAFWAHWQDSEGFTGIVSEDTICQFGYLREEDHAHIPYDDAEANAQLITLLVNHYPELKAEIAELRRLVKVLIDRDPDETVAGPDGETWPLIAEWRHHAETALAQKQGEET